MTGPIRLFIAPISLRQANQWVTELHRHNRAARGHKFSLCAVGADGTIHGVAIIGRPKARHWDDGFTAEINRTVTDGTPNVNSFLYARAWRVCREMGYRRVVSYTQGEETGISLVAAGYRIIAERPARNSWADSTANQRLKELRDPIGTGGMPRKVWERST